MNPLFTETNMGMFRHCQTLFTATNTATNAIQAYLDEAGSELSKEDEKILERAKEALMKQSNKAQNQAHYIKNLLFDVPEFVKGN